MKELECKSYLGKDGRILTIDLEIFATDPREDQNVTDMVCFHGRYNLGDKQEKYQQKNYSSWKELKEAIIKEDDPIVIEPLYLLDHSGITVRMGSGFGDVDPHRWDWGQIGFVFVKKCTVEYDLGKDATEEDIRRAMKHEVETYDQYLTGDVYGFTIREADSVCEECGHKTSGEIVDTCGNIIGIKSVRDCLSTEDCENFFNDDKDGE